MGRDVLHVTAWSREDRSRDVENVRPAATFPAEASTAGAGTARGDTMKYMLLIYGNQEAWDASTDEEYRAVVRAHGKLIEELTESGELVASVGLTTVDARTVQVRDGVPAVTDGPFTEAKEVLAGYYLVDCESIDRATEIATRVPEARFDPVEVRRLMDDPVEQP
ncbi:YciI family protein [Actinomadura scrupuli]|uniref:YciI family protein n=1 Tax=Actinomadura scrupuli TaxID=559629 RepID=UPI003D9903D3